MHARRPLTLDQWLASAKLTTHTMPTGGGFETRDGLPQIVCADGTKLSVQAGEHLYSTPRANRGPWSHVEVGYPTVAPGELWREYAEEPDHPTRTIYAYIPAHLVCLYIAAHGGMVNTLEDDNT